jgi:sarcosine oxidase subunit beta
VAIVGGGVMGLATAYHLANLSRLRVAVVERSYLVSGASGRNGGGIRMQWGDEGNVRLMMESIEICDDLAQELGINLWFRQGGYLFLARTPADEARLLRNAELHRSVGAPTRLLSPSEARDLVPQLDVSGVRLASFNPRDGVVFPWPFVWGYAARAIALGVTVRTHTNATHLESTSTGLELRFHTGERLRAARVVNATGAWCHGLNACVGVALPNRPHRHEILSTEPLKPFLDPLVVDLESGLYFSQSTRGEIVMGVTMHGGHDGAHVSLNSSLEFLGRAARALVRVLPAAAHLDVLRQWAGPYDVSPDGDAIVGPSPGEPRLIQLCGFTGHGFMMAPAVGRLLARWLVRAEHHPMLKRWDPSRFRDGRSRPSEDMIIG